MESAHMHGVHNRTAHLTNLYSDVKKSALTNTQIQPELSPQFGDLHRKYRIQKDRLITWGLQWSDGTKGPDGNIDESVARAGLTETVDSVLRNIKEVTEEAERIQKASLPGAYNKDGVKMSTPMRFDEKRYEDLLIDLTASIDTLYDLSESRRALARGEHPTFDSTKSGVWPNEKSSSGGFTIKRKALASNASFLTDTTLVNPSFTKPALSPYKGLPPRIDRAALRLPEETPPPYEAVGVPSTTRLVAQLSRNRVSEVVQNSLGSNESEVSVLVEYAEFDSTYRETGVPPPLQRLEALAAYFQPVREESQTNLSLLGYFEDPNQPRIGLIYDLPYSVQNKLHTGANSQPFVPLSLLKMVQKTSKTQTNSGEPSVPALEDRFRMAFRLSEQLHSLHDRDIAHGNINSSSIIFATTANETGSTRQQALRSPLWASFDLFSKCTIEGIRRAINLNIYRHPLDEPSGSRRDFQADLQYDLYGLGLVLLEIGLWMPIGELYKQKYSIADFKLRIEKLWIPKLASKCGTAYQQAVETCLRLSDHPEGSGLTVDGVYDVLLQYLRRCTLIEDDMVTNAELIPVSELEAQLAARWTQPELQQSPPPQTTSTEPLGELGLGWEENTAPDGRTYYIDHNTRTTTWEDPRKSRASQPSSPARWTSYPSIAEIQSGEENFATQKSTQTYLSARRSIVEREKTSAAKFQFTTSPSSRDFKRRITFIQQRWRERQKARKVALQAGSSLNDVRKSNIESKQQGRLRAQRYEYPEMVLSGDVQEYWNNTACYTLQNLVLKALQGSPESSNIRLVAYGESPETAKPTFIVGCTSTAKVKSMLKRHFRFDSSIYDVRVKKEDVRRCRKPRRDHPTDTAARRSMAAMRDPDVLKAANPEYQQRPLCGASIGAYRDDEHLPPVSFGGIVVIDGRAFGMSVHHMLEPDDDDDAQDNVETDEQNADDESETSSLGDLEDDDLMSEDDDQSTVRPPSVYDVDDGPTPSNDTAGDCPGISPGDIEEIAITQPALDDAIDLDLHVDESDDDSDSGIDEDHLLSYKFGQVYASSGLRRTAQSLEGGFKSISQSLPQEIDWALFDLSPPRQSYLNIIKGGSRFCTKASTRGDTYPESIRLSSDLACAKVHCLGRTSGLGSGMISSTMELVKIRGRHTFSASWTVAGNFGIGGDSGAWVVSSDGKVCGHVLASKKGRTYICPMDLLFDDIKMTLGARDVSLPTIPGLMGSSRSASGRSSEAERHRMMTDAIDRMHLAETESGGVAVPKSPLRSSSRNNGFVRTAETVETAG